MNRARRARQGRQNRQNCSIGFEDILTRVLTTLFGEIFRLCVVLIISDGFPSTVQGAHANRFAKMSFELSENFLAGQPSPDQIRFP